MLSLTLSDDHSELLQQESLCEIRQGPADVKAGGKQVDAIVAEILSKA